MFANIRRHQKWLWILISTLVILSFVWFFSPEAKLSRRAGGASGEVTVGSMNGQPLSSREYREAYHESQLRYFFSYGEWPGNDEVTRQLGVLERETRNRLLLVDRMKKLNIRPSDTAVAQWIMDVFRDREQKVFQKEAYDRFISQRLPGGITKEDFERFVRHEVGIQHLISVAGLPGKLVTPQEAAESYRREHEQVEAQVSFFHYTNYLASVTVDPSALAQYYTNQMATYAIPERVQVSYIRLPASNYLAQADKMITQDTNLNARIEQLYSQRGANAFVDTNGQVMAPAAAKEKIKMEARENYSLREARKEAIDFMNPLLEMQPKQAGNLDKLAAAKGIVSQVSSPFAEYDPPAEFNMKEGSFAKAAFALTAEEPFLEQPFVGEDAVYVVALKNRVPREIPPLDAIRPRVTEDFKRTESQKMARQAGMTFHSLLTNGLAAGRTFEAIGAELRIVPTKLAPFTQAAQSLPPLENRGAVSSVKNAAFALTAGLASPFTPTGEGGFVLQLLRRIPVSESELKTALPAYLSNLRKSRQSDAFYEWFRKEMDMAKLSLPGDKRGAGAPEE